MPAERDRPVPARERRHLTASRVTLAIMPVSRSIVRTPIASQLNRLNARRYAATGRLIAVFNGRRVCPCLARTFSLPASTDCHTMPAWRCRRPLSSRRGFAQPWGTLMANDEHVALLKRSVFGDSWNEWRKNNPDIRPDLVDARLLEDDLGMVDLHGADLRGASLKAAYLNSADLSFADLGQASLADASLFGASLRGANLSKADL